MDILGAVEAGKACISLDGDSIIVFLLHTRRSKQPQRRILSKKEVVKPLFLLLGIWSWDWLLA